jgi:hypothetical protein
VKAPTRVIPLAAACALCLTSGLVGGLSVAMMGAGQRPHIQPEQPTRPVAGSPAKPGSFYIPADIARLGLSDGSDQAVVKQALTAYGIDAWKHLGVHPITAGGFALVITPQGRGYVVASNGSATPVLYDRRDDEGRFTAELNLAYGFGGDARWYPPAADAAIPQDSLPTTPAKKQQP